MTQISQRRRAIMEQAVGRVLGHWQRKVSRMDPNRKLWNQQQQTLQRALARPDDHQKAIELFFHRLVHLAHCPH